MSHRVNPAARLRGELRLPGDKSISHRALLFAALAEGETLISGAGDGHDVRSTAGIIRALGASCERLPAAPDDAPGTARWRVLSPGRSRLAAQGDGSLDCGNSGTSARLGAGLVAGVSGVHVLDGDASLRRRPMARVLEPLRAMGAAATGAAGRGLPGVAAGCVEAVPRPPQRRPGQRADKEQSRTVAGHYPRAGRFRRSD